MKNQVLRKAEKIHNLNLVFSRVMKIKKLTPPSLSSLRENATLSKSALSFWNKWYHKQEHYVIMDICHISQNVEK